MQRTYTRDFFIVIGGGQILLLAVSLSLLAATTL